MSLTFNAERHEYRWLNKVVPSVTQVLQGLHSFANVPWEILAAACDRGSDVHAASHYYDDDDLDEDQLHATQPQIWNYLQGYKRFLRDCEPNYTAIEEPVYHPTLRFAGTPDRRGEFTYKRERIKRSVIDIKTSEVAYPIAWEPQCIAYAHAANEPDARRFTLQLRDDPNGDYRLREWTDPSAWPTFVSLLTIRNWSEKHA